MTRNAPSGREFPTRPEEAPVSVRPATPEDTAEDGPLYLTVTQFADGRVQGITVSDIQPDADGVFRADYRSTVWTALLPENEGDESDAVKALDLSVNDVYRDEDRREWSKGEGTARAFHSGATGERAFLRSVEALVLGAGYFEIHAGLVSARRYGLIVGDPGDHHVIFKLSQGWVWAVLDSSDIDGWSIQPESIAPAWASARRLAGAITTSLVRYDLVDASHLRLRDRVCGSCRRLLHWLCYRGIRAPGRTAR